MSTAVQRRQWLGRVGRSSLALATGALAGCALTPPVQPAAADPSAGVPEQVAPGVWLLRGQAGETEPANRGRIGNAGFVVGPRGVLAVDSGVSFRHGQDLLAAIARVTPLPVRQLLLTHVRQEFVLGAAAFQAAGVPVAMHPAAAQLMAARCEGCLKTLQRVLGSEEMAGSRVVRPDRGVGPGPAEVGEVIGRPLRLLGFGPQAHSSGPGDLALLDEVSGTLFAGGLLDAGTIPDVQDADFTGWREALAELRRLPLRRIVPGHGPLSPPVLIEHIARYLDALEARTAALLAAGTPLSEVADASDLPDFAGWDQYDTIHRRNASVVFLRQERALMRRPSKDSP